jgi:hypothetical protein
VKQGVCDLLALPQALADVAGVKLEILTLKSSIRLPLIGWDKKAGQVRIGAHSSGLWDSRKLVKNATFPKTGTVGILVKGVSMKMFTVGQRS